MTQVQLEQLKEEFYKSFPELQDIDNSLHSDWYSATGDSKVENHTAYIKIQAISALSDERLLELKNLCSRFS